MLNEKVDFEERIKALPYQRNPHIYYRQIKEELEKFNPESRERLNDLLEEVYDNYEREMDNLLLRAIYGE
ncbi:hypothetical protein HYX15_03965 [Candidatus Woesearchaeota archaeon]|nr:hypothetical protein [Candidatus Woesearchaeota archaeon]